MASIQLYHAGVIGTNHLFSIYVEQEKEKASSHRNILYRFVSTRYIEQMQMTLQE